MGGYGALRNGLSYLDTFGTIIALSNKVLTKSSKEHFDAAYPIYQRLQAIVQTDRAEKMPDEMDIESLVLNALEHPEKNRTCIWHAEQKTIFSKKIKTCISFW